ncbi:MAG: alkene reductase [Hyphomicrobiaceae bacterium]
MTRLFEPIRMGRFTLPNRIIMPPLTRGRADAGGVPGPLVAEYYAQRADAGLLIAEATAINSEGDGWHGAPGIYTDDQVDGWRRVADAVHAASGRIFVQLWHMGRTVLSEDLGGERPLAPSEVPATGDHRSKNGVKRSFSNPRAMNQADIDRTVADFVRAAERAINAGLDGVEIHAANNFLIDLFLRDGTNRRTDAYGGPPENRARFLIETTQAVSDAIGADRVGVRFSPTNAVYGITDSSPDVTFPTAAQLLNRFGLAYLHIIEPEPGSGHPMATDIAPAAPMIRAAFDGPFILNGGIDQRSAEAVIQSDAADAVAFGIPFIANPDLVSRFRLGLPLNVANRDTFYTAGPSGYVDYPTHASAA